jgi:hypothetical protein
MFSGYTPGVEKEIAGSVINRKGKEIATISGCKITGIFRKNQEFMPFLADPKSVNIEFFFMITSNFTGLPRLGTRPLLEEICPAAQPAEVPAPLELSF